MLVSEEDSRMSTELDDELASASSVTPGSVFSAGKTKTARPKKEYKQLTQLLKSRSVSPEPHRSASPSTRSEKPGS